LIADIDKERSKVLPKIVYKIVIFFISLGREVLTKLRFGSLKNAWDC